MELYLFSVPFLCLYLCLGLVIALVKETNSWNHQIEDITLFTLVWLFFPLFIIISIIQFFNNKENDCSDCRNNIRCCLSHKYILCSNFKPYKKVSK